MVGLNIGNRLSALKPSKHVLKKAGIITLAGALALGAVYVGPSTFNYMFPPRPQVQQTQTTTRSPAASPLEREANAPATPGPSAGTASRNTLAARTTVPAAPAPAAPGTTSTVTSTTTTVVNPQNYTSLTRDVPLVNRAGANCTPLRYNCIIYPISGGIEGTAFTPFESSRTYSKTLSTGQTYVIPQPADPNLTVKVIVNRGDGQLLREAGLIDGTRKNIAIPYQPLSDILKKTGKSDLDLVINVINTANGKLCSYRTGVALGLEGSTPSMTLDEINFCKVPTTGTITGTPATPTTSNPQSGRTVQQTTQQTVTEEGEQIVNSGTIYRDFSLTQGNGSVATVASPVTNTGNTANENSGNINYGIQNIFGDQYIGRSVDYDSLKALLEDYTKSKKTTSPGTPTNPDGKKEDKPKKPEEVIDNHSSLTNVYGLANFSTLQNSAKILDKRFNFERDGWGFDARLENIKNNRLLTLDFSSMNLSDAEKPVAALPPQYGDFIADKFTSVSTRFRADNRYGNSWLGNAFDVEFATSRSYNRPDSTTASEKRLSGMITPIEFMSPKLLDGKVSFIAGPWVGADYQIIRHQTSNSIYESFNTLNATAGADFRALVNPQGRFFGEAGLRAGKVVANISGPSYGGYFANANAGIGYHFTPQLGGYFRVSGAGNGDRFLGIAKDPDAAKIKAQGGIVFTFGRK